MLGIMETCESAWTALAGIADMVTRLTALTDDLQTNGGVQGTLRTGIAKGKNRQQVELINLTAGVAGDLHSYAVKQGDDALAGQSDIEISDLVNTADALVGPRCRELHTLAMAHAAALIPYGTTAADLTALDAAITAYEGLVTAPRQATAVNSGTTATIAKDVADGMTLLRKEVDKAMIKFKAKNAEFYQAYHDARVIVDLGKGHHPPATPTPPTP